MDLSAIYTALWAVRAIMLIACVCLGGGGYHFYRRCKERHDPYARVAGLSLASNIVWTAGLVLSWCVSSRLLQALGIWAIIFGSGGIIAVMYGANRAASECSQAEVATVQSKE